MKLAIIGAGPAGLAAAWALRDSPIEVQVFEKSRGVSGRAASRTRHGARFDFGANYIRLDTPELEQLVLHALPTDDLTRIEAEVWTFDGNGKMAPGDPAQNRHPRWTYSSGISTLGKLLADTADAPIHLGCRVTGLQRREGSWSLTAEDGITAEGFDAVLLTPPAPQCMDLLGHSTMEDVPAAVLGSALKQARYHAQWCFALGFPESVQRQDNCFAMINTDRSHDIAWLSFENDKPGRELGGATVMMVQMSPAWTVAYLTADAGELIDAVTTKALSLLGGERPPLAWWDSHRWRYAHPFQAADTEGLRAAEAQGLYFAGDALVGKGRVGGALQTGLDAAARLRGDQLQHQGSGS